MFYGKLGQGATWLTWYHCFWTALFLTCFPFTLKRKASVFKFLRLEERFRNASFPWRISVDGRHWPPACLRSRADFNFVGTPAVVSDCRRWKYFTWAWSGLSADAIYDARNRFFPQFVTLLIKYLKIALIRVAFRANLSTSAIHRRCTGDPMK